MKKMLVFLFVIINFSGFTQSVDTIQIKEFFKERFISLSEARIINKRLPETLLIPYSMEVLMNDFRSWLVPIIFEGVPRYILVKPIFSSDILEAGSDTLTTALAKKFIYLVKSARPDFPHRYGHKSPFTNFYRTKTFSPSKNGMLFKEAIAYNIYNNGGFLTVGLPIVMEQGLIESNYISYVVGNNLGFVFLKNSPDINERSILVLTLVYVK